MRETRFPLVPDRQDQNRIVFRFVAVERDITRLTTRDDRLANAAFDKATDQRVALQNGYRFGDQFHRLAGGQRIGFDQKINESLKIIECAGRIDQPCHERALGFATFCPEALAFRKACTSSASRPLPVSIISSLAALAWA
jgi:hypothetical protein